MQLPHTFHPSKNAPHESSRYIVITETSTRCKFDAFPRDCRYLPGRNYLFLPPPLPVWKTRNRISLEPAWQSFESMPRLTIERASISSGMFPGFSANRATLETPSHSFARKGNDLSISNGNSREIWGRVYFMFAIRRRKSIVLDKCNIYLDIWGSIFENNFDRLTSFCFEFSFEK